MKSRRYWKNVRYVILIISVVAAIVTPTPDAKSMLIFMAPLLALYFIGTLLAAIFKGGSGPRGGPQHPLPVATPFETPNSRRSS
jgi:Sec-independent protein secretion pathway component TatC